MKKIIPLIILSVILSGCAKTIWVHKLDNDSHAYINNLNAEQSSVTSKSRRLPGIPFYKKREKFNQTTKYSKTWFEANLKIEKILFSDLINDKNPSTVQSFTTRIRKSDLPRLDDLKQLILNTSFGSQAEANAMVKLFQSLPAVNNPEEIIPELISNTMLSVWAVDGSQTYYVNAPLPWFGSNTFSQEINSDGTLSKTSSAPDTKIAESITSLIPLKEYLTGRFVTPLTEVDPQEIDETIASINSLRDLNISGAVIKSRPNVSSFVFLISLDLNEKGYVYTFNKNHLIKPEQASPIPFNLDTENFSRNILGTSISAPEKDKEINSIGIQGSITLPKSSSVEG